MAGSLFAFYEHEVLRWCEAGGIGYAITAGVIESVPKIRRGRCEHRPLPKERYFMFGGAPLVNVRSVCSYAPGVNFWWFCAIVG
jgi:hypothetical protein